MLSLEVSLFRIKIKKNLVGFILYLIFFVRPFEHKNYSNTLSIKYLLYLVLVFTRHAIMAIMSKTNGIQNIDFHHHPKFIAI